METEVKTTENNETKNHGACGCGSGGCGSHSAKQSPAENQADLPERFQLIQEGDRVVDFGSGLGKDCITLAGLVGSEGKVVGIDRSEDNIREARKQADTLRLHNLEFRQGSVESVPLPDEYADVIYASCVFNLLENKQKVADEMYRVIRHNGYVCVSDFVTIHPIPESLRSDAATFAGSIGGAEKVEDFMSYFRKTGFEKGGIVEVNKVQLPQEMLEKHLDAATIAKYNDINEDEGIFSVVLVVEKPESCNSETCCHNPDKHKNG
jgi:arsenite methyltransferase